MQPLITVATRITAALTAVVGLILGVSPQQSAAQPAGFPSLDTFALVPVDGYFVVDARSPRWVYFSTPYNVQCDFNGAQDSFNLPPQPTAAINCNGDIPGLGNVAGAAAPGTCPTGHVSPGANGQGPGYALSQVAGSNCGAQFARGTLLNPGQKISYKNGTCAVGADQLIACLDTTNGEHGFVLQPSGSFAF